MMVNGDWYYAKNEVRKMRLGARSPTASTDVFMYAKTREAICTDFAGAGEMDKSAI